MLREAANQQIVSTQICGSAFDSLLLSASVQQCNMHAHTSSHARAGNPKSMPHKHTNNTCMHYCCYIQGPTVVPSSCKQQQQTSRQQQLHGCRFQHTTTPHDMHPGHLCSTHPPQTAAGPQLPRWGLSRTHLDCTTPAGAQ